METIKIYTDGACKYNPGPGGWAYVNLDGTSCSGRKKITTNNEMELTAIKKALESIKEKSNIEIYSDSAYCVNSFNKGWIYGWIKKGWKKSDGQEVANKELMEQIYNLTLYHQVKFIKVEGHAGDKYNELCDTLATSQAQKYLTADIDDKDINENEETVKHQIEEHGFNCPICGKNDYEEFEINDFKSVKSYVCKNCGHIDYFLRK